MKRRPTTPSWTPADITTHWWADMSDAMAYTESGGVISVIGDKSGNGNSLTNADAALHPALISDGDSYPAALFAGDWLANTSLSGIGSTTDLLLFLVIKATDGTNSNPAVFSTAGGVRSRNLGTRNVDFSYAFHNGITTLVTGYSNLVRHVICLRVGQNTSTRLGRFYNGVDILPAPGDPGLTPAAETLYLASYLGGVGLWPGSFYEGILIQDDSSLETIELVNNYLMTKWGIV